MPTVQLSPDGRTATVNGQLVALEQLPPDQQSQIRSMAQQEAAAPQNQMPIVAGPGGMPIPQEQDAGPQWAVRPGGEAPAPTQDEATTPGGVRRAAPGSLVNVAAQMQPQAPARPPGPAFIRTTNTSKTTSGITPGDKRAILAQQAEGDKAERDYLVNRAQYEGEVADANANAAFEKHLAGQRAMAEVKDVEGQGKAEADYYASQANAARMEAADLRAQGHDFWADKSTGQKVIAGIGAFFGGALAGMNGGPNQFLEHVDRLIAREDQLHRDRVEGAERDASGAMDMYNMARARTNDEREAMLLTRDMQYDAINEQLQTQLANLDAGSGAALGMQQAQAELLRKQQAVRMELADRQQVNAVKRTIPNPAHVAAAKAAASQVVIPGTEVTDPQAFATLSSPETKQAREFSGAANALIKSFDDMIKLRESAGTEMFGSEASTDYVNAAHAAKVNISQMLEQGTITKADAEQMVELFEEDLSPRLNDIQRLGGVDPTLNKLKSARKNAFNQANSRLRAFGLKVAGTGTPGARVEGAQGGFK